MRVHHPLSMSLEMVPDTTLSLSSDSMVNKRDLVSGLPKLLVQWRRQARKPAKEQL